MELIYKGSKTEVLYEKTNKFKMQSINVDFMLSLSRRDAFKITALSNILPRATKDYPTTRDMSLRLMELDGATFSSDCTKKAGTQIVDFRMTFLPKKYTLDKVDLRREATKFIWSVITKPLTEKFEGRTGFDKEIYDREIELLNLDIESIINDKGEYAKMCMTKRLDPRGALSIQTIGELGDSDKINPVKLFKFYRQHFLAETKVVISFVGIESPNFLIPFAKKFDKLGKKPVYKPTFERKAPIERRLRHFVERMDVHQGKLEIGMTFDAKMSYSESLYLSVMNALYGVGPNSKLFTEVRERNSLAYYAGSNVSYGYGVLRVTAGVKPSNAKKAERLIISELQKIQNGDFTDEELEIAKKTRITAEIGTLDSQTYAIDEYLFHLSLGTIDEYCDVNEKIKILEQTTREDIIRVANLVHPDMVFLLTEEGGERK